MSAVESGSEVPKRGFGARPVHIFTLIPIFVVAMFAAQPIRDNSFLWHIKAGAVQLSSGLVLVSDPFSSERLGEAWRTQSWLLEIFYSTVNESVGSLSWVNGFVFIVGLATLSLIGVAVYRSIPSPAVVAVVMIGAVWLSVPFLQPRPVIVSYLLLAGLVVVLQNRAHMLWLVVPLIWVWAGVHGSWVLGAVLLVLELLRTRDIRIAKVGVVAFITTFATAHGLGVYEVLIDFVGAQGALSLIQEWQPPDFGALGQAPYVLIVFGIIGAALRGKISGRDLIVILPFLFFGMTSRRAVFPAAIVLIPWAASAIPAWKAPASGISRNFVLATMGLVVAASVVPLLVADSGSLDSERFPSPTFLQAVPENAVFHDDVVGGYLIYAEWPQRLVYLDDRAELYGEEYFESFVAASRGEYEDLFAELGFDAAIVRTEWPLADRLDRDGWLKVIEEEPFILFERP